MEVWRHGGILLIPLDHSVNHVSVKCEQPHDYLQSDMPQFLQMHVKLETLMDHIFTHTNAHYHTPTYWPACLGLRQDSGLRVQAC
jgi:hypothetical protein